MPSSASPLSVVDTKNASPLDKLSVVKKERELERIREKTHQLRSQRAGGSMERSNSVESSSPSGVSWTGRQEQENMLQKFHSAARTSPGLTPSTTSSTGDDPETYNNFNSLALHDLCAEAVSKDDIAWRNAVALLAKEPSLAQVHTPEGWNPLHICCMGPVPYYVIRCLLYAYAPALAAADEGKRLPLHLLCASPYCDVEVLQLIVEEYPVALSQKDNQGFVPLHLLLRNTAVECTTERIRILLGWTISNSASPNETPVKFRKGHHLQFNLATLEGWRTRPRPVTNIHRACVELENVPPDVQAALRQLAPLHVSATGATFNNPAAIPDPSEQLPLHQLVQRAVVLRQPLDTSHTNIPLDEDGQPTPSVPQVIAALRLLICAHPEGLLCRNAAGHTPLSAVLSQSSEAPSVEIIEYLTGTRLQLEQLPAWAHDLPLARDSPATMTSEQQQLPLHIAAEEWADHVEIIRAVKEAYPAAIQQKDSKGRTPLHRCFESYRRIPVPVEVIELLYSDYVATIEDDSGRTPLQVLVKTKQFPPHEVSSNIYRRFFEASPVDDPNSLSVMPPWLQRQACSSHSVQNYILQALSRPVICSFVLLDGLALVALITLLRLQLRDHFDAIMVETEEIRSWYTYAVYGCASLRLMLQAIVWILQGSIPFLNFWTMNNVVAMLSALATSVLLNGKIEEEILLQLGTLSTGLLWLALIGYLSTWWYGMAIFTGSFLQITSSLVWPLVAAGALLVAGSQMFYTFLLLDCDSAVPGIPVCTAPESYRFVYALIRGETFPRESEWSRDAIILVSVFLLLCILWIAATLLNIVIAALRLDLDKVALKVFWEPQLAIVLSFGFPQDTNQKEADHPMQTFWNILTNQHGGNDYWYKTFGRINRFILGVLSIFVIPLWILIGALTLGWLWPPQVREWIFHPNNFQKTPHSTAVVDAPITQLRQELQLVKLMSYEKAIDTERELQRLRELLQEQFSGK